MNHNYEPGYDPEHCSDTEPETPQEERERLVKYAQDVWTERIEIDFVTAIRTVCRYVQLCKVSGDIQRLAHIVTGTLDKLDSEGLRLMRGPKE